MHAHEDSALFFPAVAQTVEALHLSFASIGVPIPLHATFGFCEEPIAIVIGWLVFISQESALISRRLLRLRVPPPDRLFYFGRRAGKRSVFCERPDAHLVV